MGASCRNPGQDPFQGERVGPHIGRRASRCSKPTYRLRLDPRRGRSLGFSLALRSVERSRTAQIPLASNARGRWESCATQSPPSSSGRDAKGRRWPPSFIRACAGRTQKRPPMAGRRKTPQPSGRRSGGNEVDGFRLHKHRQLARARGRVTPAARNQSDTRPALAQAPWDALELRRPKRTDTTCREESEPSCQL